MSLANKDGQLSLLILIVLKFLITAQHGYFTCSRSLVVDDQATKHKDNLIQPILQGCKFFMSYVMDNMSRHVKCHDITYNLV